MEIKINIQPPVYSTKEQLKEWIYYELNLVNKISVDNPLCDYKLLPESIEF